MTLAHFDRNLVQEKHCRKDGFDYQIIFLVTFLVFLIAALVERLMPWRWPLVRATSERRLSVFAQAKESAGRCTAYAFMG